MRGKAAAQNANRRANEALVQAEALRRERAEERERHRAEVEALKVEVARLRSEHRDEAGKLAEAEVARQMAVIQEERRQKGLSDDVILYLAAKKDQLIMNACRYLSMTKGEKPEHVLPLVLTWALDRQFRRPPDSVKTEDFLIDLGVPLDGWTAVVFDRTRKYERYEERWGGEKFVSKTVTLDQAEQEGHPDIHPAYKPRWYGDDLSTTKAAITSEQDRRSWRLKRNPPSR